MQLRWEPSSIGSKAAEIFTVWSEYALTGAMLAQELTVLAIRIVTTILLMTCILISVVLHPLHPLAFRNP